MDQGVDASGLLRCRFMSLKSLKLPAPSFCLSHVETNVFFMAEFNFDGNLSKTSGARSRLQRDSLFFFWQKHIEAASKDEVPAPQKFSGRRRFDASGSVFAEI